MPTTQPGRRYALRGPGCGATPASGARTACGGQSPTKADPGAIGTYYRCPYSANNPRHAAAHPDRPHASISVREELLLDAIGGFLDDPSTGQQQTAPQAPAQSAASEESEQGPIWVPATGIMERSRLARDD
jgi:hypothetical protein